MSGFEFFLLCVFLFFIFVMQRREYVRQRVALEKAVDEAMTKIHVVKTEMHEQIEYWYDRENSEFLAQGENFEAIIQHAKSRFPTHTFYLPLNDQLFMISGPDWKMKEIRENKLTINA